MQENIKGYALALLDLAIEEKKLDKYKKEIIIIMEVLKENPTYLKILESKNIDQVKKLDLATKTFQKITEKSLKNYILLLIEKNKINILLASFEKFISFVNDKNNIFEGVVYSVVKLKPSEIKTIENKTSKTLGYKVVLKNKIDVHLISGIKVLVNGEVIDNSIETQIELLKQQLLEGKVE